MITKLPQSEEILSNLSAWQLPGAQLHCNDCKLDKGMTQQSTESKENTFETIY